MKLALSAATLLLASSALHAQIYKCTPAGSIVFSDRPCAEGAGVKLKTATDAPNSDVQVEVVTTHYPVTGSNVQTVAASIKASNPGGFWGWAHWKVDYVLGRSQRGSDCSVSNVSIHMAGQIMMPQWKEEKANSDSQQYWWQQLYASLMRHEQGHIQNGRDFELLLKQRLLGLGTVPCAELDARARREFDLLYANLGNRDREYDRRTQHGLRQDNPE
jgi:predicted secreted Zn-dependent protease